VTRPARTRQRRRRASASSTWSSSRPRSTAPSRRAAPRRTSSPPTRRSRANRRLHAHLRPRRVPCAPAGRSMALTPRRGTVVVRGGERLLSAAVTGQAGTDGRCRNAEGGPAQPGSTTSVGTASAARRVSTRSLDDDAVWLVPAMALTRSTGEAAAVARCRRYLQEGTTRLPGCGRATDRRFKTYESVPDGAWTGQPIWECRGVAQLATAPPDRNRPRNQTYRYRDRPMLVNEVDSVLQLPAVGDVSLRRELARRFKWTHATRPDIDCIAHSLQSQAHRDGRTRRRRSGADRGGALTPQNVSLLPNRNTVGTPIHR